MNGREKRVVILADTNTHMMPALAHLRWHVGITISFWAMPRMDWPTN